MVNYDDKPLYRTWSGIKTRCLNKKSKDYPKYGGRGITVCDRWKNSYKQFAIDMGDKPSSMHSVERIDNNKGYCPENCRWGTKEDQSRNRRIFTTNTSGETGVDFTGTKWRARIYLKGKRVQAGYFNTKAEAIVARQKLMAENWSN